MVHGIEEKDEAFRHALQDGHVGVDSTVHDRIPIHNNIDVIVVIHSRYVHIKVHQILFLVLI